MKIFESFNKFPAPRSRSITATLAVIAIYFAVYVKDFASILGFSNTMAAILLGVAIVSGMFSWIIGVTEKSKGSTTFFFAFLVAWMLTLLGQGKVNTSSYYIAIPCAFVVMCTSPRLLIKLLFFHLLVTLFFEAREYFTGNYLYIYQDADGSELNEVMFGGAASVFRAKGLFQGPLSAVAFALWMAFIFRGSVLFSSILFFCAFFASGRLGMLASLVLISTRVFKGIRRSDSLLRNLPIILAFFVLGGSLLAYVEEDRLSFILSAIDIETDQNSSRLYFWQISLSHFFSYSPIEMLFGNYGFIKQREGGTENDFLRLILDCGLVGFFIYLGAVFLLFSRAIKRRDFEGFMVASLIVILMNVFPFIQSLSSALLFWVYFFSVNQISVSNSDGLLLKSVV